jgi:hypothetical protein
MTNEELVQAYIRAVTELDRTTEDRLRHPDWTAEWPQSGERVRGSDRFRAIQDAYPGGYPTIELERVIGAEDRWSITPSNTVMRVVGSGEYWWAEFRVGYPDGIDYHCVTLLELRDGRIFREIVYWAPPFEAPGWRASWVEKAALGPIR